MRSIIRFFFRLDGFLSFLFSSVLLLAMNDDDCYRKKDLIIIVTYINNKTSYFLSSVNLSIYEIVLRSRILLVVAYLIDRMNFYQSYFFCLKYNNKSKEKRTNLKTIWEIRQYEAHNTSCLLLCYKREMEYIKKKFVRYQIFLNNRNMIY